MSYHRLQWKHGTPYSVQFDDVYHSREGGIGQACHVFLRGNDLPARFAGLRAGDRPVVIMETGFGTGLNFIITVRSFLDTAPEGTALDFISVEKYLLHPDDIRQIAVGYPELQPLYDELIEHYPLPVDGIQRISLFGGRVRLTLLVGDVIDMLASLDDSTTVDGWYLDGFSPACNSDMWSDQTFAHIARLSHIDTSFATYTVAGAVKRGLKQVGFDIVKRDGYGGKREMLAGRLRQHVDVTHHKPWFMLSAAERCRSSITVVGAGIAGLTTCLQLVRRGYEVTLIDRDAQVAQQASGNPAGLVLPRYSIDDAVDNSFFLQSLLFAYQQYSRLQTTIDERFWFATGVDCGISEDRFERLRNDTQFHQIITTSRSDRADAEHSWFHYLYAGWLRPQLMCQQILKTCSASLDYVQADIVAIDSTDDTHRLIDVNADVISDTSVVVFANAAGVMSVDGLPDIPMSVNPGQVTSFEAEGELDRPVSADCYATPSFNGRFCTGASYRDNLDNTEVLPQDHDFNLAGLAKLQPSLRVNMDSIEGRVSERASSPDRVPITGGLPDVDFFQTQYHDLYHGKRASAYPAARHVPGLFLNVAHGSRGLTTAFLCAEIIASMIDGAPMPVSRAVLDHLNPSRFLVRRLKKSQAGAIC